MRDLLDGVDEVAADHEFSGVVSARRAGTVVLERAYGLAHRAHGVPATIDTRFAVASITKGFTALVVLSLVDDGVLALDTTARSVLGPDLPQVDDTVTVEQLLAHTSGIGDYVDEDAGLNIDDYVLPGGAHRYVDVEDYLPALDGHPPKFAPGARFGYCNSRYVVLALLAQRTTGAAFVELVTQRVLAPAGMTDTAFLRADALPGRTASGYLTDGVRTNVLHLPLVGGGDGGAYSTVADLAAFWDALFGGRIVARPVVDAMVAPRRDVAAENARYGLGFWLDAAGPAVRLEGYDAGISARTTHNPETATTVTVLANTSASAWPLVRHLTPLTGPRGS